MKILNCITNSFFRTIGRILAYLAFGALLVALLSKAHLPSFEEIINDSLFMKVNASTITWVGDLSLTNLTPNTNNNGYYYYTMNESFDIQQKIIGLTLSDNKGGNELRIPFLVSGDLKKLLTIRTANGAYTCSEWKNNANGYYCSIWEPRSTYDVVVTDYELNLNILLGYYDGGYGTITCTIDTGSNTIVCPLFNTPSVSYTSMRIYYSYKQTGTTQTINFNINSTGTILISDTLEIINNQNQNAQDIINSQNQNNQAVINNQNANTNATIDNQNQNTQQITNTLTNNTLNDNEIESELQFDMPETSLGPFSGFLALPLTWVQSLLSSNNNCSELVLPLPFVNQNLTLPCMYSFWQKMGILGTLVQAVWIAVVGVRIFNGLFLLVVEVRSPEGNADYLTKIRSWEL